MKKLAALLVCMSFLSSCAHHYAHSGCSEMNGCKSAGCGDGKKGPCGTGEKKCADSKCADDKS